MIEVYKSLKITILNTVFNHTSKNSYIFPKKILDISETYICILLKLCLQLFELWPLKFFLTVSIVLI